VQRLPAKYRGPVVLCYLEGRTNEEAARELRWPVGTIKGRLSRARELLRKRLTRRGLALPAVGLAAALAPEAWSAAVSPGLLDSTVKAATQFAVGPAAAGGAVSAPVAALTRGVLQAMWLNQLKTIGAAVLAVVLAAGGGLFLYQTPAAEPARPGKARPDAEAIQGDWEVTSFMAEGKDAEGGEADKIKSATWVFTKDKILIKLDGETREATYKLDPTRKPRTIDVKITKAPGGEEGKKVPALYKLEGDSLTICLPIMNNTTRPTELETKEGSKQGLLVLKRKKK
jgi:uncharacterized protein (TIGR03067 family)